jgi:hypothetical protein
MLEVLLLFGVLVAHADSCAVPVCDIPAQIEVLRSQSQSQRFQYVSGLRAKANEIQDEASIENLRDFALAAHALFLEINEEDWMIREPGYLADEMIQRLLIRRRPVYQAMERDFRRTIGEGARYAILHHWAVAAETLEDTGLLQELLSFSEFAERYCTERNDSDYVPREAASLRQKATARYMQVYPTHEGIYELGFARLVVLETFASSGLVAVFTDSRSGDLLYSFPNLVASGDLVTLDGRTTEGAVPRFLRMKVDVKTGAVEGEIRDSRGPERALRWSGRRIFSPVDLTPPTGARCAFGDENRFEGALGASRGTLVVRRLVGDTFGATFRANGFSVDFRAFYLARGVLHLVHLGEGPRAVKLSLACQGDGRWQGVGFSNIGGVSYDARFQEVP